MMKGCLIPSKESIDGTLNKGVAGFDLALEEDAQATLLSWLN
jgi:hypothetical protein